MNEPPQPPTSERPKPRKLFREPAKTSSVQCGSCGGPITLHGFGQVRQVSCPYCGSTLEPDASGALAVVQAAQRARKSSVLPLHLRGTLDGIQWETLGVVWREAISDGIAYPWQEILLHNPYKGYRWLIYSMTDGHWSIAKNLDGSPDFEARSHPRMKFKGKRYRHFQHSQARVTYVEGEFPWQIQVGDESALDDYILPPKGIGVDRSEHEWGSDLTFTEIDHITPEEVWSAFGMEGKPPPTLGVGPFQPNLPRRRDKFFILSALAFLGLWTLISLAYIGGRDEVELYAGRLEYTGTSTPVTVASEPIEIATTGRRTTLKAAMRAPNLSNSWVYADVLLVDQANEKALNFGIELQEYHGPGWSEGSRKKSIVLGNVPGGSYLLQVRMSADPKIRKAQAAELRIVEDIPLYRYVVLPLLFILCGPILNWVAAAIFEARRWKNSDYGGE